METTQMNTAPERIRSNGVDYVRADIAENVYRRIYQLIVDQKQFFKTKDPSLKQSCKKREDGYLKWYENGCRSTKKEDNQQTLNFS